MLISSEQQNWRIWNIILWNFVLLQIVFEAIDFLECPVYCVYTYLSLVEMFIRTNRVEDNLIYAMY